MPGGLENDTPSRNNWLSASSPRYNCRSAHGSSCGQPADIVNSVRTLSGAESVGLTRLLMSVTNPTAETVEAIESSVAWLKSARIDGIKLVEVKDASLPKGRDRVVERDASARPMWARFYEIETGRPIYAGRDGVKKYALAEIEYERRNGYSWLSYWPETLLEKDYPAWKATLVARGR